MKTHRTLAAFLSSLTLLFLAATLHAQVPQLVNYQGRVAVGTVNFNGTGQFKFALVNAAGTTTYWSNDGTSAGGLQPAAAVSLTVTKGLYSVLLGDTTLANMTAIPVGVFANSDVRLRVWFNDGTNSSQLLTPDQRIAAVGYAVMAAGVELPETTSATEGVISQAGTPLIHTFGSFNFYAGFSTANFTGTGPANTATGAFSMAANSGSFNTGDGFRALGNNTSGSNNTAAGARSLFGNNDGRQ